MRGIARTRDVRSTDSGARDAANRTNERANGGQTRIAGLNAVGAVLFEVIEERQDHGSIEVVQGERLGFPSTVLIEKREQQAEGIAVGADGLGAGGLLLHEMVDEERTEQRADGGTGGHGAPFPSTNASKRAAAGSSTASVAVRYQ